MFKAIGKFIKVVLILVGVALVAILGINLYMTTEMQDRIITPAQSIALNEDFDCILVLGCSVKSDGEPSAMLQDRVERAVELYFMGAAPKILMSGDNSDEHYNEVYAMKELAVELGVPSEDIFTDHAGFSTYETMYRAREIYGVENCIIVTQEYHLYRAMFIANAFDISCYGVSADGNDYFGQTMRDVREWLARAKDFVWSILKPLPTYLGEFIGIEGDGDELTLDLDNA